MKRARFWFMFLSLVVFTHAGAFGQGLEDYMEQGTKRYNISDFRGALEAWQRGLALAEKEGNKGYIGAFLGNLGVVYKNLADYPQALSYYQQALKIHREIGAPTRIEEANIGDVYLEQGRLKEAYEAFQRLKDPIRLGRYHLKARNYPKAREEFSRSLKEEEAREMPTAAFLLAETIGLGLSYEGLKDYPKAKDYFQKGIDLIDRYALSVLPAASLIEHLVKKRKPRKEQLLVLANPQADYLPLGYAEVEGKAISALFPQSELYSREKATETLVKRRASDFNILHLATHGEFNERQPLQSGLLLARDGENDGQLQVHEIFGMDLRQASLVTLSACETALSRVQGGDDLVGLSRGFIYAGTPSLLATLWKVDDPATARLMESFYRNWQQGMSKPEALRQAQLALKRLPQYQHPYYWAPFVMIGDWK